MDSVMNDEWPEPQVKDHDAGRRLYDCTYCKRGFTNAQALGGHMNIHRKDRAKIAKQPNNPHHHPRDVDQHSVQTPTEPESSDCYPVLETQRVYYAYLLPSGSADPIRPAASPRMWDQGLNVGDDEEEDVDANLSLRVGPAPTEEEHNRGAKKGDFSEKDDDDLDLELRLGHDP